MVAEYLGAAGQFLGGAGSLAGAFMDTSDDDYSYYAKHRIRHTVRDAKKAGIHPLFALGSAGAYRPTIQGQSDRGGAIADAANQIGKGFSQIANKRRQNIIDRRASAESMARETADYAKAAMYRSEAALNEHRINSMGPNQPAVSGLVNTPYGSTTAGSANLVPDWQKVSSRVMASRPGSSVAAGPARPMPMEVKFDMFGKQRKMLVPQSDQMSEAFSLEAALAHAILAPENLTRAGIAVVKPYLNLMKRAAKYLQSGRTGGRYGRNRRRK
jgi:hypothetical protein